MANSSYTSASSALARHVELTLETQHMNKVLRELEGSPFFEKTLTRSYDPIRTKFKCGPADSDLLRNLHFLQALPSWFVQEHGDKFQEYITLRTSSSAKKWKVRLSIYKNLPKLTQVKFARGWKEFATFNDLKEGDSLIFSLVAMSKFIVYRVFPGPGKCSPSQSPVRKWHNDRAEISRKKAKTSHGYRIEHSLSERNVGKTRDERCELVRKKASEERDDVAESTSHSATALRTSPRNSLHLLEVEYSSPNSNHDSQNSQKNKMAVQKTREPESFALESKDLDFRNITKSLPGFRRRYTSAFIEVSASFVKTHGMQLQAQVHLQGIRDESPIRSVMCALRMQDGVRARFFFRTGWTDFVKENGLREGQELEFSLAGESFFVMREVTQLSSEVTGSGNSTEHNELASRAAKQDPVHVHIPCQL